MKLDKPLNLNFEDDPTQTDALPAPVATESPSNSELRKQFDELKRELQAKNKLLDAKNQEISELKIKNRQLNDTNKDIQARQKLLEEELGKAEAQIEMIQELLLTEEQTEELSKKESGKHG